MEKQPHQEYRDDLANKLKEIRNSDQENSEVAKVRAEGYLEAKSETSEYRDAQEKHKEEIFTEHAPAEVRAEMLWDKIDHNSFSKEDLVEALRSIDKLYEYGQIVELTWYYARLLDVKSYVEKYNLGKHDEYDYKKMDELLKPLRDAVKKVGIAKDYDYKKLIPYNLSHADRVFQDRYEHAEIGVLSSTAYEYNYDRQDYNKSEISNRLQRAIIFLDKFRKSPEQIEKEREDIRLKKQAEEGEKQIQIKEKELNKFDPSI
jgi:hypothetical protein